MPVWLLSFVGNNWKPIGLLIIIAGVMGYITVLRADIKKHDAEINRQKLESTIFQTNIAVLKNDVETAKLAIESINEAVERYQQYVQESLSAVKESHKKIQIQNTLLQTSLDNLAILAMAAVRILDAPKIPFFFASDNTVPILINVDNGVYHYRLLPR
jgi:hypothetical protein